MNIDFQKQNKTKEDNFILLFMFFFKKYLSIVFEQLYCYCHIL